MSMKNMGSMQNCLFQLKFMAKSLKKQSRKALKDSENEKAKVKRSLTAGDMDSARVYAQNVIRKKNESLNLLKLQSRVDAVASRIETAMTVRALTVNIESTVRSMDRATETMNLEQITRVMDKFEEQLVNIDVQTSMMQDSMSSSTAESAPQDQIDLVLKQLAEETNIEILHEMGAERLKTSSEVKTAEEDSNLAEKLRALRPAT